MISHEAVLDKLENTERELAITDKPCWWTWKRLQEMTIVEIKYEPVTGKYMRGKRCLIM